MKIKQKEGGKYYELEAKLNIYEKVRNRVYLDKQKHLKGINIKNLTGTPRVDKVID